MIKSHGDGTEKKMGLTPATNNRIKGGLRLHVAIGMAVLTFFSLIGLSVFHVWREWDLMNTQVQFFAQDLGDLLLQSLTHEMIHEDKSGLERVLGDLQSIPRVHEVLIIGTSGKVYASSGSEMQPGMDVDTSEQGCNTCHQMNAAERPRVVSVRSGDYSVRVAAPIDNTAECQMCHVDDVHLGMLLIDMSVSATVEHMQQDFLLYIAITLGITLLVTFIVYWVIDRLVVRRLEAFLPAVSAFSKGNYSYRVEDSFHREDEISSLGRIFNQMAQEIEAFTRQQALFSELRYQWIVEERQRLARELHDGIAQLLAYINSKLINMHLLIQSEDFDELDKHIAQLDHAVHNGFQEVREIIAGLSDTDKLPDDFVKAIADTLHRFEQMSDIPVKLDLQVETQPMMLDPIVSIQLVRIVQEVLSNVRKHAHASHVRVNLVQTDSKLTVRVSDNGVGFDPSVVTRSHDGGYGLKSMAERAQEINGELVIQSKPGEGTTIEIHVPYALK